jgi:prepilin signal peptidase PulO-like enzyme (type II secretory pathway)
VIWIDISYIIFLVVIGCCVGSFLNVVVYRLPLGLSLLYPPSHCPQCKKLIQPYDNIPVFGWFLLRGRCRNCRERINFRYPAVEAISGLIAGSISATIFYAHSSLPYFDLVVISLYYFVLVMTLFAAGLIEFDRNKIPAQLFLPVTIITPFIFYYLDQIKFYTTLNKAGLLYAILAIIICCAVMFLNFMYFVKPDTIKKHSKRKTKKQFRLQIITPVCTSLVLGLSCGLIAIPILLYGVIVAALFLRYRKSRRLYLLLTGATWVIIIYCLAINT